MNLCYRILSLLLKPKTINQRWDNWTIGGNRFSKTVQLSAWGYTQPQGKDAPIVPQYAVERLQYHITQSGRDTRITTEVGQHQMWAAQYMKFDMPYKWMTSGGLGTMGYGFPASMGVQIANPDALTICVAGDASIQMNIQEMATCKQYKLPVKVFYPK